VERRDSQEPCAAVQRTRDTGARWLQCAAAVADIPFVFRHWNTDDASPWHLYTLQYRAEYTYRRLGVQRATAASDSSDRRALTTRRTLRDATARYSADSVTDGQTLATSCKHTQSERVGKPLGRSGHRSAPASFVHVNGTSQRHVTVVDDEDITTLESADHQLPAAKSLLRCPAVTLHLNSSSLSAGGSSPSQTRAPPPPTLPHVSTEHSSADSRTHQPTGVSTSDSQLTFIGKTTRHLPSDGFSVDDRTVLVTSLFVSLTCLYNIHRGTLISTVTVTSTRFDKKLTGATSHITMNHFPTSCHSSPSGLHHLTGCLQAGLRPQPTRRTRWKLVASYKKTVTSVHYHTNEIFNHAVQVNWSCRMCPKNELVIQPRLACCASKHGILYSYIYICYYTGFHGRSHVFDRRSTLNDILHSTLVLAGQVDSCISKHV